MGNLGRFKVLFGFSIPNRLQVWKLPKAHLSFSHYVTLNNSDTVQRFLTLI